MTGNCPVQLDYTDPAFLAGDRYPIYRMLRDTAPVARIGPNGSWLITRYEDCAAVYQMRDVRARPEDLPVPLNIKEGPAAIFYANSLGRNDPPHHTRLRALVGKALSARSINALQPDIAFITNQLLDDLPLEGACDIQGSFADRIPVHVMARLIGLPPEDMPRVMKLNHDLSGRLVFAEGQTSDIIEEVQAAAAELKAYIEQFVEKRSADPRPDLTTALIEAREGDDALTSDEIVGVIGTIVKAGTGTIGSLISTAIYGLLGHPEQLRLIREQPGLLNNALEEFLRWNPPGHASARFMGRDAVIGGEQLRAGDQVWLMVASANHDERRFPDPEALDINRKPINHISFGGGSHFCPGSSLARLQAKMAIAAFFDRLTDGHVVNDPPARRADFVIPNFLSLDIEYRFRPGANRAAA